MRNRGRGGLELIRAVYDSFAQGDVAGAVAMFDSEIDWQHPPTHPYQDQIGPTAVLENVIKPIGREIADFKMTAEQLVDGGETIVGIGHYSGTGRATNVALTSPFVHVWTVRGDKVIGWRGFTDTQQWIDVLGRTT